ncbi:MAG TPA: hypothetical protein VMK12_22755, partial [Anaeromyxobacteraceae bacterium]|nr:hypothetical protein [Anaeromyxobacteraceae bacterium]
MSSIPSLASGACLRLWRRCYGSTLSTRPTYQNFWNGGSQLFRNPHEAMRYREAFELPRCWLPASSA